MHREAVAHDVVADCTDGSALLATLAEVNLSSFLRRLIPSKPFI